MAAFTYKEAVTTVPSLLALQYIVKTTCVFLARLLFQAQVQECTAFLSQGEAAARACLEGHAEPHQNSGG